MAQPRAYDQTTSFDSFNPSSFPNLGRKLDVEFENIETTTDEIRTNLALIQRDDGALANDSVGTEQLKNDVRAGINTPAAWVTATAYVVRDSVTFIVTGSSGYTKWYKCLVAHTSGVFATDLANGYWELILQADPGPTGPAGAGSPATVLPTAIEESAGAIGVSTEYALADHEHEYSEEPLLAFGGKITSTITTGSTNMTARRRYRITGGTGVLPTMAAGDWVIVEYAPAAGTTATVGRNSQTIDGASSDDTYVGDGGNGPVLRYSYSSAGAVVSRIIEGGPI